MNGVICLAISDAHVQFIITRLGCRNLPKQNVLLQDTSYFPCSSLLPPAAVQELQDVLASLLTIAPIASSLVLDTH